MVFLPLFLRLQWVEDHLLHDNNLFSRNKEYQFWQQDNHAIQLETAEFTLDKLNYMHNNPIKAGIVGKAEEYLFSSARDYYHGKGGLLPVEHLTAAYIMRPI